MLLFTHFCSVRSVKIKGTIYKSFVLIPLANYKSVFLSCENFLNESKVRVPKIFMCVCIIKDWERIENLIIHPI